MASVADDHCALPAHLATLFIPYEPRQSPPPTGPAVLEVKRVEIQPIMERIREAVGDDCSICGQPINFECASNDPMRPTVEHVYPKSLGGRNGGNRLLAHKACNWAKGNRMPTGCEIIRLLAANAVLGGNVPASGAVLRRRNREEALSIIHSQAAGRYGARLTAGHIAELAKLLPTPEQAS